MLKRAKNALRLQRDGFAASARNLKDIRVQAAVAMLLALNVALSYFGSFYITQDLKVSTSFLALSTTGFLFGPIPAALSGAMTDVVQYVLRPAGPYFPGYTISGFLGGLIYGMLLYRRERRALMIGIPASRAAINLFVNIGLNTLWLHILYGTPYFALLPARAVKNAALLPVEVALMYGLTLFLAANRRRFVRGGR